MAVKIRLRQQGRTNKRMFRLVAADGRSPRDGKYLETLGWYNPHEDKQENKLFVHADKVQQWIDKGAQMTPKAKALVAQAAPNIVREVHAKKHNQSQKTAAKRRARKKKTEAKAAAPKAEKKPAKSAKAAPKASAKKTNAKTTTAKKKDATES